MISAPARTDQTAILTPEQIAEANHYRACGVSLKQIAQLFDLTKFELVKEISIPEKTRQMEALRRSIEARGRADG